MIKNYLNILGLALAMFASIGSAEAQCVPRTNFYFGELAANAGCGTWTTSGAYGPGEYFRMPVLQGGSYSISTCGAGIDTQITGFEGTTTATSIFYNDDNGPHCGGTAASIDFVPTFTDYTRVAVQQYNCLPGGTASITVSVRQNNNLTFTSSTAAMCAGDTRILTATPTPVTVTPQPNSGDVGTFTGTGVSGTTFTAPTPTGASELFTLTYTFGFCSTTQDITVYAAPSTADAGPNQTAICGTSTTLQAATPAIGNGTWTVISGPGTVVTPGSANSSVTGLVAGSPTTLEWTVTNGPCTASTSQVTLSLESVNPVPSVATLTAYTAECSATPPTPTANDNCAGVISGVPDVTFPITTFGTTAVTWTYDDGNGNIVTQMQDVIVGDATAPTPDVPTLTAVTGECSVASVPAPTGTDNCVPGTITATTVTTFPITAQGTTTITWSYDDGNGNVSTQTQDVILTDVTNPVADAGSLADVVECNSANPTAPTATDNCAGTLTGTPSVAMPITTPGLTVVTWTYTDGAGNTTTQTQNVTVNVVDAGVTQTGATLTADAAGASYQWLDCDNSNSVIIGETNQSMTPLAVTGNYAVEVTENGCVDTSACYLVDYTGIDEVVSSIDVSIYPNPSQGKFNVELLGLNGEDLELRITDLQGRIVLSEMLEGISGSYIEKVDISKNESGVYIISVIGADGVLITKRIIKE